MRSLLQYLYAPLFWFGFIGAAAWILSLPSATYWSLVPLAGVAILLSFAVERLAPFESSWNRSHGDQRRDIAHALTNESLNVLGLTAWAGAAAVADRLAILGSWPHQLPFGLQLLLGVLICDLGITLMHVASHRYRPLWRLHAVHHSVKRMYGFNGLMKHPFHQLVEATGGFMPLLLLGAPTPVILGVAFATLIQLLLQHSNVDMKLGPLRKVFAFAPVHRLHHLKYGRAGDVNFGFFFNIWDHLLGTALDLPELRVRTTDLGIGNRPDYPVGYLAQLREPFNLQGIEHPAAPLPEWLQRR